MRDFSSLMQGADVGSHMGQHSVVLDDNSKKEQWVEITCMTTQAAAQVLMLLSAGGWRTGQHFTIGPMFAVEPPFVFTMVHAVPDMFLEQVRAVPDSIIGK